MITIRKQALNKLVACLIILVTGSCRVNRPPSRYDIVFRQIILNNPAFRNELEEIDIKSKDSLKKRFAGILQQSDEASIANENNLSKYFQQLFIDSFSNNDNYFFASIDEKTSFKKIKMKAHYSYDRVIDIMSAERGKSIIHIYYDNLEKLDNFLFIKSIEDSLKTDFFSYYYFFVKKFIVDDTMDSSSMNVDALEILDLDDTILAKIHSSHPLIELSHRKIPLWFMLFHEFGHIYLNTSNETTADSFAYSHIERIFKQDTSGNFQRKVLLLTGILDLIEYLYFEKEFLEKLQNNIISNKSELIKRRNYFFDFLKNQILYGSRDSDLISKLTIYKKNSSIAYTRHTPFQTLDTNIAAAFDTIRQSKYFIPRNEKIRRHQILHLYENFTKVKNPFDRDLLLLCLEKYYEIKEHDYSTAIVFFEDIKSHTQQLQIKDYCERELLRLKKLHQ